MSKKNSITAMALGIASLVLGVNGWETFAVCGVAGLVCAIISFNFQKKAAEEGAVNGFTKAAKVTSIIGLILSIIGIVGGIICGICYCTVAGAATAVETWATVQ